MICKVIYLYYKLSNTFNVIKGGESVVIVLSEHVSLEIDDNGGTIVVDGSRYEFFNEEDQE